MRKNISLILLLLISGAIYAQRGKSGALTVAATVEVNEYTYLTADAATGNTSITVAASTLNAHGRFPGNLAAGDLIMIIQLQGATLNGSVDPFHPYWGDPNDSSYGAITNYNNCGNYEYAEVNAVPNGTSITLDCGLTNSYTAAGKVEIVRVPRYTTLTINNGGTITCDTWDSAIGGIIAVEVDGNTVINAGGSITGTGLGFRGGILDNDSSGYGIQNWAANLESYGKQKGESVGGFTWGYAQFGFKYCMGAPGNGGGGANAHNGGGGGGANGGVVANYINGYGNPDVSTADNQTAWRLEDSWLPTFTSAGGGRGGYTFSSNRLSPLTTAPGNTGWGGDNRNSRGGRGGRPVDYSTGRIFLAGGGGSGDQDDNDGGGGGNGGAIIYVVSYGTVSGAGQIISNGANGVSTHGSGIDGAGGAGGGGTIIVNSTGNISGITLTATGGTGGNQAVGITNEAEGPGGGGGGGYIGTSNLGLTENVAGGPNGTTNSPTMANFPPNGATIGGVGTDDATITNFTIIAKNDTICSGQSATLTASLSGTVPSGTTIEWYTVQTGGSPVGTGATYTTPALTVTTTYYVGTCPGTYRQAVTVVISGSSSTTISPNKTICKGSSDSLKATGGTAYSWLPTTGLSCTTCANPVATPTATTTYTVTITTSCGQVKDSVKVTVSPLPTVTFSATTNPVCKGSPTTITASGGTGYSWSTGATTSSITVTPAATITYTLAVSNGTCTKDTSYKITVNPVPTPTIVANPNPVCAGSAVTITASGGSSYTWNTGKTTSSITVNPTTNTTYSVIVSNGTCTKDTNIAITVNAKPTVTVNPSSASICPPGNVILSGVGASTYTWTPNTNLTCTNCVSTTASPTNTTTYTVIGTSTLGCMDTATVVVTVNTLPVVTLSATKNPVCAGTSTTITATGGSSYSWSTGASTSTITVTPGATITYTLAVSNGTCTKDTSIKITVNPLPTPTITANPNPVCAGSAVIITASGGSIYTWSNGKTTSSITVYPTVTTNYSVIVNNGTCTKDTNITININPKPVVTVNPSAPTICIPGNVVLNGLGASTYTWTPTATLSCNICTTTTASPTVATTYTVIGTSALGCKDTANVTVSIGTPVIAGISATKDSVCSGTSTTITATGGSGYTWSNGASTSSITVSPTSTTNYSVVVSNGSCTKDTNITITVNPLPNGVVSASVNPICAGESTVLTASGGVSYLWNTGKTTSTITVSPSVTTTYTATVSNGTCTMDTTIKITVNPKPVDSISPPNPSICPGGSINFNVTGANSYTWAPNTNLTCTACSNPTATPTANITYTVYGTSSAGCLDTTTVSVSVVNTLTATITPPLDSVCIGSFTSLTAGGGATYLWSNGASTATISVNPTVNTIYSVMVSSGACKDSAYETVKVLAVPVVSAGNNDTICGGGSTTLTATGASSYNWKPSAGLSCTACQITTANPTITTTYTVVGSNGAGCTDSSTVTVNVLSSITAAISPTAVTICADTSTTLTATGGGKYLWSNGATTSTITISPASTTIYKVVVTSGTCKDSATSTVTVNPVPSVTITPNQSICIGDSVNLNVSGGGTYLWSTTSTTTSINVKPTTTTTYNVKVTNNGCSKDTEVVVVVSTKPIVTVPAARKICAGTADTIVATGGGTYSWSNGATTDTIIVNPTTATVYSLTVTNGACSTDTVVKVGVNPLPSVTLQGNQLICQGDSATLVATGGGTYLWSTSQTNQNIVVIPSGTTTYSLAVTKGGCTKDTTMTVTVNPKPVPTVNGPFTLCLGESANLNASGGSTYSWNPSNSLSADSISNPVATPASNTEYIVTLTSNAGCVATDSIRVNVLAAASGGACCDATIEKGGTAQLSAEGASSTATYSWTPGEGLSCTACANPVANPTVTTTYYLTITDSNGCTKTDSIRIAVYEIACAELFLPEAFSPNGDGHNDVLLVRGDCIASLTLEIFDRWGNKMFESTNQADGWDGTYKGQPMNTGTYVYYLDVILNDGTKIDRKGNVTLVR